MNEIARYQQRIEHQIRRKFKRRFALVALVDLLFLLGWACAVVVRPTLAVVAALALSARFAVTLWALWRVQRVHRLYTKLIFHRQHALRRFANVSSEPALSAWVGVSVIAALSLVLALIALGAATLVASTTSTSDFAVSCTVALAALATALYLWWSERTAYRWCVVESVDSVLAADETRRAYVTAAARNFADKISARLEQRSLLGRLDGAAPGHNAPNAKHESQKHK